MNALTFIRLAIAHRSDPFYHHFLAGRSVLDVGCGRGEFLEKDPGRFVGVDLDPALVEACRARGLRAEVGSATGLTFPDAAFEVVRAAQLIEHLHPDQAARLLAEAARVLKPGGRVFLTTPGIGNAWNTFSHIRPYPPIAFKKLLSLSTEGYIGGTSIPLAFEGAWGTRWYSETKLARFLGGTIDMIIPPSNAIGWTIVLRRV
jgi:SAM-dependent methyltransferase